MNVLFVCVANSGRSVMAERLFGRAAAGRHEARSAGSQPGSAAHPQVLEALRELGMDGSDHVPHKLDEESIAWLPDPKQEPLERVRAIRDDIARRVDALVYDLDKQAA